MANLIQDWLLDPTALVFLTSLATIVLVRKLHRKRRRIWQGLLLMSWLAFILTCTAPAIVNPLIATLEDLYPESQACEAGSHLVMLGGGVDSRVRSAQEFERMSHATMARASSALRISQQEPQLRLIAAGGALKHVTEADVIASYWISQGVDDSRIVREGRSANTRENALNVAALLDAASVRGPVRLVTSAMHMPRALHTFRKVFSPLGIEICPVSVDREALYDVPIWALMPQTTALVKFDKWLHELGALAVYRLRGWL